MSEDVIELIVRDHRAMLRLCGRLRDGEADRQAALGELNSLALAHFRAVEQRVHSLVAREFPAEESVVGQTAATDLRAVRLLALLGRDPVGGDTARLADQLVDALTEHIRNEEAEVLPALREAVATERLEALGELYRAERDRAVDDGSGPDGPPPVG